MAPRHWCVPGRLPMQGQFALSCSAGKLRLETLPNSALGRTCLPMLAALKMRPVADSPAALGADQVGHSSACVSQPKPVVALRTHAAKCLDFEPCDLGAIGPLARRLACGCIACRNYHPRGSLIQGCTAGGVDSSSRSQASEACSCPPVNVRGACRFARYAIRK